MYGRLLDCKATAAETSPTLPLFLALPISVAAVNHIDWHSCFVGTTHQEWSITGWQIAFMTHREPGKRLGMQGPTCQQANN